MCVLGTSGAMCKEVGIPLSRDYPPAVTDNLIHHTEIMEAKEMYPLLPPSLCFLVRPENVMNGDDRILLRINAKPSGFWKILSGKPDLIAYGYGAVSVRKKNLTRHVDRISGWWYDSLIGLSPGDALHVLFLKHHTDTPAADARYDRFVVTYESVQKGLIYTTPRTLSVTAGRHMLNHAQA